MDVTRNGPLAMAERRLNYLDQRQRVLAQNVANADTPGFRPRDLQPFAQHLAQAQSAPTMVRTSAAHLAPQGSGPGGRARAERATVEVAPDGNAVSLDREALRIAETDQAHAMATNLYRRWTNMYRTAIGRGQ